MVPFHVVGHSQSYAENQDFKNASTIIKEDDNARMSFDQNDNSSFNCTEPLTSFARVNGNELKKQGSLPGPESKEDTDVQSSIEASSVAEEEEDEEPDEEEEEEEENEGGEGRDPQDLTQINTQERKRKLPSYESPEQSKPKSVF